MGCCSSFKVLGLLQLLLRSDTELIAWQRSISTHGNMTADGR